MVRHGSRPSRGGEDEVEEVQLLPTAVEAVDELLQVAGQMFLADTVVGASKPALEVGEDRVCPGQKIKSRPDARVLAKIEEHDGELATCAVVWHELRCGAIRLPPSKKRRAIEAYLEEVVKATLPILPYDEESAAWHAHERARLGKRGRSPSAADGQIAAIARVYELVLVTANVRDFRRFEGLSVQDWTR